jgi:AbrB family looped-hinge helix DNA binding protein
MPTATVSSKGQITIPIEVRKALALRAGDRVNFFEDEEGRFTFEPKTSSIMDLEGMLEHLRPSAFDHAPTSQEMDEAILKATAEDYLRSVEKSGPKAEPAKAS